MKPVLVLGGSGQLGTALRRRLAAGGRETQAPGRDELDLTQPIPAGRIEAVAAVINAAAYNDVDGAEEEANHAEAFRLNRDLPGELAALCAAAAVPLVHVSTDYVFDGTAREPYVESSPTAPLSTYGRSKLAGERAVLAANPAATVVRTSTVYGEDSRQGSNFVAAILRNARRHGKLEVVEPPVSSPTYAVDLAAGILELLEAGASGIVHLANRGACSRLQLATEAVRLAGLAERVPIRKRAVTAGGAARPAYSALDTRRFTELTGKRPRTWEAALAEYVRIS
jgi:dTDP-4-dehydrorhamnose reductase